MDRIKTRKLKALNWAIGEIEYRGAPWGKTVDRLARGFSLDPETVAEIKRELGNYFSRKRIK